MPALNDVGDNMKHYMNLSIVSEIVNNFVLYIRFGEE